MLDASTQKDALLRLRRIEGQIRGLEKMVTNKRYCIDILNQVAAVRRALDGVSMVLMKKHVETCVSHAIRENRGPKLIDELIGSVSRFVR